MPAQTEFLDRLLAGERTALARAITLVESRRAEDGPAARELVEACLRHTGEALRLGITGIPGAGKSTLIDALGTAMIRKGNRVAVLAIDPSSASSGGSILGDKTRMERLSQHPDAFIRPTAAGGHLGGIGRRTREAMVLCEAAGYDRIIVETVGTGQSELDVDTITDLNVLLLVAGTGDELQGIKRGIMESADAIAFTKCDGEGKARAEAAQRDLRHALQLLPARPSGRRAEVMLTSGISGLGIDALRDHAEKLLEKDRYSGYLQERRRTQAVKWMEHSIQEGLEDLFLSDAAVSDSLPALREKVRGGSMSPFSASDELLRLFRKGDAPRP